MPASKIPSMSMALTALSDFCKRIDRRMARRVGTGPLEWAGEGLCFTHIGTYGELDLKYRLESGAMYPLLPTKQGMTITQMEKYAALFGSLQRVDREQERETRKAA